MTSNQWRTYVRSVGLLWKRTHVGGRLTGCGTDGVEYAFVRRFQEQWDTYIAPEGCGEPRGLWFYGSPTVDDATEAADRHVVAYIDELGIRARLPDPDDG